MGAQGGRETVSNGGTQTQNTHCTVFWVAKIILQRRTETGYAFWVLGESEGISASPKGDDANIQWGPRRSRSGAAPSPALRPTSPPARAASLLRRDEPCPGARPASTSATPSSSPPPSPSSARDRARARAPPRRGRELRRRGRHRPDPGEGGSGKKKGREGGRIRPREGGKKAGRVRGGRRLLRAPRRGASWSAAAAGEVLLPSGERRE